jgi:hypothetical protein
MKSFKVFINETNAGVTGVDGVRGLGFTSGNPSVVNYVDKYVNTNTMSYNDENGNKLALIKKMHHNLHNNKLGYKAFDPTKIGASKNFGNIEEAKLNELGGDYDRSAQGVDVIGDLTGASRKVAKVNEVKKIVPKAKKAAAAGMVLANVATLGNVAGGAAEGKGHPVKDIAQAVSGLPGKSGWAAMSGNYTLKGVEGIRDYVKGKLMKEDKDPCWKGYEMVGMKTKKGRKVPNCVPTEEQKNLVPANSTERGIYEVKSSRNPAKAYGIRKSANASSEDAISKSHPNWTGLNMTSAKAAEEKARRIAADKASAERRAKEGTVEEATYKGKTVTLNKPMKGDVKKSKVFVDPDGDGKAQKVNFGDKSLSIKKNQPGRKKSYCSRSGGIKGTNDKTSANYWSRRAWDCEEETQIDEISAELVGKVSNARWRQGKAPSKTLSRAINKKFIESGKKKEDDTPFEGSHKRSHEKSSTHVRRLAVKAMKAHMKEMDTSSFPTSRNIDDRRPRLDSLKGVANATSDAISGVINGKSMQQSINDVKSHIDRQDKNDSSALDKDSGNKRKVSNDELTQKTSDMLKPKMNSISSAPKYTSSLSSKPVKEETTMDTKELVNEALDNILEDNLVGMKENLQAALQEKMMEKLEERKKNIAADYFAQ